MQKGNGESFARINGSLVVSFIAGIHILFVLALIKKILYIFYNTNFSNSNKGVYTPFIVLILILPNFYFTNERTKKIVNKYSTNTQSSIKIFIQILLLDIVPLILIILLSKK
jgi:hypothetical protein